MTYCNNQLKDKSQASNGKARISKRKVQKDSSKPLEPNTKRDRKSEEILLKRKMSKKRLTTFDNISERGNFDTSRKICFGERLEQSVRHDMNEMSAFHEAIKEKIIQCSICCEAWPVKLKSVSKKNLVDYKCTRCLRDEGYPKKLMWEKMMVPCSAPTELQGLLQCEEMLIARTFSVMQV